MSTSPSPDRQAASNPSPAGGVQSVNRALDVLEFIGSRHPDVPIGEIATGLRLPLDLVDETGETANLAVLAGDQAEYVAQAPSRHHMRMFTEIGQRVDLHSTGVGKALLSQLDSAQVDDLLDRRGLPGRTEHTITSRVRLHAELERIRSAGFAIDEQEQELGVRCVAVPITGLSSGMAVSVSGPVTRMTESLVESTVPLLQSAARALANSLERSD
jgi:IclR family acetate operon transcriptional repressor